MLNCGQGASAPTAGKGHLGPLPKPPPLTRDQPHKLILNPKLLP